MFSQTLRNRYLCNLGRNTIIVIQENEYENVICKMAVFSLGLIVLTVYITCMDHISVSVNETISKAIVFL